MWRAVNAKLNWAIKLFTINEIQIENVSQTFLEQRK